jgi:hypothetical protein
MTRRTMFGIGAAVTGAILAGATALAFTGHGARLWHHHWSAMHRGSAMHGAIMRRVAAAIVDDALDAVQATPEQRAVARAARDRVLAAVEEHQKGRRARMDEALALFEGDALDPGRVAAFRRSVEDEHGKIADAVSQALADVHQVLTPAQRKQLADHVRAHRHGAG